MKSNEALEREIKAVANYINERDGANIGQRGSVKYTTAFAVYDALLWARGRRVKHPVVQLMKMESK